ncbi:MAG: gas vesicle protein GvpG [Synergistaceae bacterium]|nr:gas vesicle protein GvpG [Synergistaceae bacterium]
MLIMKGLTFIAEEISKIVDREQSDEGTIKERLMELQMKYEMDEISEEEYDRKEEELLKLLEQAREKKGT